MTAVPGLHLRRVGSDMVGTLRIGANSVESARTMADGFLARRGIVAEYLETTGGQRLKVGVYGLRRYDVRYRMPQS